MKSSFFARPSHTVLGIITAVALATGAAHAAMTQIDKPKVGFVAEGPGGLKIEGEGNTMSLAEAAGVITMKVPWSSLKTGMDMRDDHMKKYMNAAKHPEVTVAVERSKLSLPADKGNVTGTVQGKVTFNGVTKDTPIEYKITRTGSDYHVQGRFGLNLDDFKVEQPCYLGVCVNKDVKVKAAFKVRE